MYMKYVNFFVGGFFLEIFKASIRLGHPFLVNIHWNCNISISGSNVEDNNTYTKINFKLHRILLKQLLPLIFLVLIIRTTIKFYNNRSNIDNISRLIKHTFYLKTINTLVTILKNRAVGQIEVNI
jgi:hypothetical protein